MFFWFTFLIIFLLWMYSHSGVFTKKQYWGIFLLVFIGIFRYDIGWDYPNYYNVAREPGSLALERFELLNQWVYFLVYKIGWPPLLFITYGLLTYALIIVTLKKYSTHFCLAMCVYMAFFYTSSFGAIRQAVAVAIVLFAYRYLYAKQYMRYILCVIIASLWHNSAYVAIFIPLIYKFMNIKWMIISCIVILCGYQLLISDFATRLGYESYLKSGEDLSGGNMTRYAYVLVLFFTFILYRKLKFRDTETERLFFISAFGMFLPFLVGGHLGGRVAQFFYIYFCLLIPRVLRFYSRQVRGWYVAGISVYFLLLIYVSTQNPIKTPLTPYKTIFVVDLNRPTFKEERFIVGGN